MMSHKEIEKSNDNLQIINFSPYAFINVHAYPESIVCKALSDKGHHITQIRCKGIYQKNCISMSAAGVWYDSTSEKKAKVCSECQSKSNTLKSIFGFDVVYADDFITEKDLSIVNDMTERVDKDSWSELMFENIPIGKYASYEFLLNRKISAINFDDSLMPEYRAALWNALVTAIVALKIISKYSPDRVITYNNLYSCNHVFSAICANHNSSIYSLHAGGHHKYRLSQMTIFKDYIDQYITHRTEAWHQYAQNPIENKKIKKVYEHIEELLEAKSPWVYSIKSQKKSADELKNQLHVPEGAKVLLAMMASGDERFAASLVDALPAYEIPFFETQLNWIEFLIKLAAARPDIFLIIRVHPREFPNKREKILSTQASILLNAFNDLPDNVIVNWPDDNISLHDLVKIVDVGLNATSTSGLELLMFGIPVVIYDSAQLFSYPREFNYVAKNRFDYARKIDDALSDGISFNHIVNAFRWLSYCSDVVSIDIASNYRVKHTLFRRILNKLMRVSLGKIIKNYYDLSFNRTSIFFNIKNQEKLVYAIENNKSSHIGAFLEPANSAKDKNIKLERIYLRIVVAKYFKKIGLGFDRFEQTNDGHLK